MKKKTQSGTTGIGRFGRTSSLISFGNKRSLINNDSDSGTSNRNRSYSEPWVNSWDFKILRHSSGINFRRDKKTKGDISITNNKTSLGLTDVVKEMKSPQLSKVEVIENLKQENVSSPRIRRHASVLSLQEKPKKNDISLKRLSMKHDNIKRENRRRYDRTSRMSIKTFKIIDKIIQFSIDHCDNSELVDAIVLIERFISPMQIIIEHACRYYIGAEQDKDNTKKLPIIKRGIISLIGKNISIYPYQFISDDGLINIVNNFIDYLQKQGDTTDLEYSYILKTILDKAYSLCHPENNVISINNIMKMAKSSSIKSHLPPHNDKITLPKPLLGKKLIENIISHHKTKEMINILYISPIELARQWTLLDHSLIIKLTPEEIIENVKNPKNSEILSEIADHFNHSTMWVAQQILRVENVKKRASVISYLIEIAEQLLELQNFQGLLAVMMGLSQVSISRLHLTWKKVPSKVMKVFKNLQTLTSPFNNFAEFRKLSENCSPPFIPSASIILKDMMTFIDINGTNFIEKNIIKTDTILLCHKILSKLIQSQVNSYKFYSIPVIQSLLKSGIIWDEDELERQSKLLEPEKEY